MISPHSIQQLKLGFFQIIDHCYFHIFFRIAYFVDLSITEDTSVVEMRIWCIKIGTD
jgi:hypothetical protein